MRDHLRREGISRKVYIQTFGCQMNEYDTDKMFEVLRGEDYQEALSPEEADLILLNTCSVREKAEQKVYSQLGRLRGLKKKNPGLKIGVGGCVAQQEGTRILKRARNVDFVFGTDTLFELPEMLRETELGRKTVRIGRRTTGQKVYDFIPDFQSSPRVHSVKAHLAITKGCDNYCSFCIVPVTRGREISRSPKNILNEARRLIEGGAKEICLLGQNVNSYRSEGTDFVQLLRELNELEGLKRIRFTSPHPKDFNEKLAGAMHDLMKVCEQLHLPLQSGSNRILKRMRRWYTVEAYLEKVDLFRKRMPDGTISTDLIVGFPGESEKDFAETLKMLEEVRYDQIYAFKYSVRPGTRAAEYADQLDEEVKSERLATLLEVHEVILKENQQQMVGTRQEILVEGYHPREPEFLRGRTCGNYPVSARGPKMPAGTLMTVRITGFRKYLLEAEID